MIAEKQAFLLDGGMRAIYIIESLNNGPEALPLSDLQKAGGDSMTNVELLAILISIASLVISVYGLKR